MLSATSDGESKYRPTLLEHSLYIRHDAKPWMAHFTHEESELWSWHFGLGLSPLPTAHHDSHRTAPQPPTPSLVLKPLLSMCGVGSQLHGPGFEGLYLSVAD